MSRNRTSKTVRYSLETLPSDETDWARLEALTDDEVMAAALSDLDAQPLTPGNFRTVAKTLSGR